jgi:hypothetical protein
VYKITIDRPDIPLDEMGAVINARMGLNTWAAFYGTDADAVVSSAHGGDGAYGLLSPLLGKRIR